MLDLDLVLAVLHYLFVFALFGVLFAELVSGRRGMDATAVARVAAMDACYGVLAGLIVIVGEKTLVTLLENAGVSEKCSVHIVGHEKPRITYGLYSGGTTMQVKREALERIRYPFAGSE